ncbi:MAG: hypothetical protein DRI65_13550 [Chloroflexota bacterium]|nr:MAG: hypothetical protein DRI65_13550 [Chloroflexota bacterium]HDD61532.1 hypothetical protein [Chloroflexota bacterium]
MIDLDLSRCASHDLRTTAVFLMPNNGFPPFVVSKRLDHANPSITMDI